MIVPSEKDMNARRQVKNANKWPGVFFACLEQIRKKYEEIDPAEYLKYFRPTTASADSENKELGEITAFKAEIVDNIPVGGDSPNHFKLRFRAHEMPGIIPGQFIMMDTAPLTSAAKSVNAVLDRKKHFLNLNPQAFLKRPFGIHRSFYPNFEQDYLKKLSLPPTLATVMHTVFPHEFDIFYKVLENGVGTKELKKLKKGHKIRMTGPLGKRFDLRELRKEGVEEVHIIGGGVGMAPLVFMAQALRFYAFKIRAFIGIESFKALKHSDDLFKGFVEDPKDVKLYVDDLLATGVDRTNIYVSCDKPGGPGKVIPKSNFHHGLISELYKMYLQQKHGRKKILAFTCGPMAMMEEINNISRKYKITLKALMEKRMACGIGVCLSCVCKTRNGKEQYSRVCVDGPVFDAREIVWQ
jgi:dihydroorotate dehydrogenase electron transfer subunit